MHTWKICTIILFLHSPKEKHYMQLWYTLVSLRSVPQFSYSFRCQELREACRRGKTFSQHRTWWKPEHKYTRALTIRFLKGPTWLLLPAGSSTWSKQERYRNETQGKWNGNNDKRINEGQNLIYVYVHYKNCKRKMQRKLNERNRWKNSYLPTVTKTRRRMQEFLSCHLVFKTWVLLPFPSFMHVADRSPRALPAFTLLQHPYNI